MHTALPFRYWLLNKLPLWIVLLLCCLPISSRSQGLNTEFGQNRVQYRSFDWSYVRTDNFDAFYYLGGRELATYSLKVAETNLNRIEKILDYRLNGRIEILVYNTLSDRKQSNIGLTQQQFNVGGVTNIVDNKLFVYFTGDHEDLVNQIEAGIANILINEMMYGGSFQERIQNATLLNLPDWFTLGLVSYISKPWDATMDNRLKDGIKSGKYRKFNRLTEEDAVFAGHSIWRFLVKKYDERVISSVLYLTRISRSFENAFYFVLGSGLKKVNEDWLGFYNKAFDKDDQGRALPTQEYPFKKKYQKHLTQHMKVSPQGDHIAFTTNKLGAYTVWILNTQTNKVKKVYRGGFKYNSKPLDKSFPVLGWHPRGNKLSFVHERKGKVVFTTYDLEENKKEHFEFQKFEKIVSFDYADNGKTIVMSAVRRGRSDLYTFDVISKRQKQLTNDIYDDFNPRFVDKSSNIIFSSNRLTDSLRTPRKLELPENNNFDVFLFSYSERSDRLRRLTKSPVIDEIYPMQYNDSFYTYLTDYNGIQNRHAARLESVFNYAEIIIQYKDTSIQQNDTLLTDSLNEEGIAVASQFVNLLDSNIASIDTVMHNRDIVYTYPISNYIRNIELHDIADRGKRVIDLVYYDNQYHLYQSPLIRDVVKESESIATNLTAYRAETGWASRPFIAGPRSFTPTLSEMLQSSIDTNSTIATNPVNRPKETDTTGYSFLSKFSSKPPPITSVKQPKKKKAPKTPLLLNKKKIRYSVPRDYRVTFMPDYFVSQLDNTVINTYYQPISAEGGQFFNPGLNAMFKLGINDIFQDHRISGGFRIAGNLNGGDYFIAYENLKKRIDKKVSYYRQSRFVETDFEFQRYLINELRITESYPFSERASIRLSVFGRQDRTIFLSADQSSVLKDDEVTNWAGGKLEYVFDNTIPKGLNLYNGTRFKIFGEMFRDMNNTKQTLGAIGFDFRNYQKIHRQIILATRFTANTSIGSAKVVYYLGGVDNWLVPRFDNSVSIKPDENFVYQALATNLRGFDQNIRNGSSFALINNEIRIPLFTYLFNRPIRSDLIRNFMVVPFGDIGTAWTGFDPYGDDNSFNSRTVTQRPVTATVINLKEPIVGGFGLGLRTKLFGYYLRGDMAWGVEDRDVKDPVYYLSLSLDF